MTDWAPEFFRQNLWANLEMIEACRALTDEQLDAGAEGTFGSIRDTLRHFIGSEGGYAASLGHEPAIRLMKDDPWPGFDGLAAVAIASADALIASCADASTEPISVGSDDGDRYTVAAAVILTQAFHHSTEHRSQVNTVLTTLGLEPVDVSSWKWGFESGRMHPA